MEKGQAAYEQDRLKRPFYHDLTPRKPWELLSKAAKQSWKYGYVDLEVKCGTCGEITDSFSLGGDYSIEYDTDTDDDYPWSLYSGDEKIAAYKTPRAVMSDLDCYDDNAVPPDRWPGLWDWIFATR